MSPESTAPVAETSAAWPMLSTLERRVLGVLVEKAKTTPDTYPLSLNSLVTGCNQKSNREPLLNVSDLEVEEALTRAQKKGLVVKITGGRVERWRIGLVDGGGYWDVGDCRCAATDAEWMGRGSGVV